MRKVSGPVGENALPILVLCALVGLILSFHLGSAVTGTKLPIVYDGDGVFYGMMIRQIMEEGWFPALNHRLGAPFGSDLSDYPLSEAANVLMVKLIAFFSDDWVVVINRFYLLSFFSVALASFLVLRSFGVDAIWAVTASVLFTFLPYHFMRAGHLLLASYFTVPIGVWLSYRAAQMRTLRAPVLRWLGLGLASFVVGSGGVYYAFFSCALITIAAFCAGLRQRSWRDALPGAAIIVLISTAVVLNTLPTLLFKWKNGPNPEVATRLYVEAELYALKPIQLLLPRPGHRSEVASRMRQAYSSRAPNVNENEAAALGIIGTIGFLALFVWVLRRLTSALSEHPLYDHLAAMNLSAMLIGTVGGLGAMFAFFVSPQIRGYNRISVFIAFISIAAAVIALQKCCTQGRNGGTLRNPWPLIVAAVALVVGVWDQTSPHDLNFPKTGFESDRAFVQGIEAAVSPGAMIFELPYMGYPERPSVHAMHDYDPGRGYLHSANLKWSYGAVRGRQGDKWLSWVSALPVDEQLDQLAREGFEGIYIDRRGYADGAQALEVELNQRLGAPKVTSGDGRFAFYRMVPTAHPRGLIAPHFSASNTLVRFNAPVLPPWITSTDGFSVPEPWGRWTDGPVATLRFDLPLPSDFRVVLKVKQAVGQNLGTPVRVSVGAETREFVVTGFDQTFELAFQNSARRR